MPSKPKPSQALRGLLENKLDTFEKLELVLTVRDAAAPMPLVEIARELQIGADVLRRVATEVDRSGLVALGTDDTVRLVATDEEQVLIAEAGALYARDRGSVIALLSAIAFDRIRGMAARSFADAFQIRKKKDDSDG